MNETIKTIMNRRSVRAYKQEQIKDEELQLILDAGVYAPSAMNQQSWHITVIQKAELISRINQLCKQFFLSSDNENMRKRASAENFNVFYNAPTLVLISGDEKAIMPKVDCALAGENMLLAAASLNIGSCWIGVAEYLFSSEISSDLKKELDIPEGYKTYYSLILGYDGGTAAPKAAVRKENTVTIIK